MKSIGKTVSAAVLAAMMLFSLCSCNSSNQSNDGSLNVEGTWKRALNEDDYHGSGADFYRNYLDNLSAKDTTLTFGTDKKLTISAKVDGADKSVETTYSATADAVSFSDVNGLVAGSAGSYTLKMKNDKLVVDSESLNYICFVKQ